MSALLSLFACCGLIFWLFREDIGWRKAGSRALLIPGAWLAIQGSRPLSYWFGDDGGTDSSPINTSSFAILLVLSIVVLCNRRMVWGRLVARNKALLLVYLYLFSSTLWSEMPFASSKRLIKDFGTVLVALVFLTGPNPADAIRTVFVRVSYILFPLSMVFIKYFPTIGRQASRAGENMFTGITTQKNSLGETVFVFGLFVLWDLVMVARGPNRPGRNLQLAIRAGVLGMGVWLLITCNSQTSLLCFTLGAVIFWGCGRLLKLRKGKQLLVAMLLVIAGLAVFEKVFGWSEMVIRALGRDPSLTGRTDIWRLVLDQKTDPVFGTGFYTFWESSGGRQVTEAFMEINSAHNGYLEMYLDGGLVGNFLLGVFMLVAGGRTINRMFAGHPLAPLALVFWLLSIVYNLSESSFFRLDVLWCTLVLLTLEYWRPQPARAPDLAANSSRASVLSVHG